MFSKTDDFTKTHKIINKKHYFIKTHTNINKKTYYFIKTNKFINKNIKIANLKILKSENVAWRSGFVNL